MDKPTFKHICLMHIQQLTNFPYIEKDFDALADYGLLCKVVDYLNQVITNENVQNDNIVALYNAFNELKNYIDNLDVQDEVNNKIDSMVQDGTLEQLINQTLFESKMSAYKPISKDITLKYSNKSNSQAHCHTIDGKFVIIEIGENDNSNILKEYNEDGTLIRQLTFTAYHPNTICYYNGYLYVGNAYTTVDDERVTSTIITKINYSNFTTSEIELTHSVAVIGCYDNKFYINDAYNNLWIYNNDFSNLISSNTINDYGDIYQGIAINENHIILSCSYSFLVFLNKDLSLDKIINLRNFDYITAGELQDIDYYDNELYILTSKTLGGSRTYYFIGSFNYKEGNKNEEILNQNVNNYSNKIVYVKSNVTSIKQLGTQNNPFIDIEQGLFTIFNPLINGLTISIYNGNYSNVHLDNINKPLEIIGREQKTNTFVSGFLLNKCNNVIIKNITINNTYNETYNYCIYSENSNLSIDNIVFSENNSINFKYGKLFSGYSISVTNSNNISVTNALFINQSSEILTNYYKPKTTITNNKSVLFSSVDGEALENTINFPHYTLSNFKTLKMNLKITSAATTNTWYKTIIFDVKEQNKLDLFLQRPADSIYWWSLITLNINFTNNRITGSYQDTKTIDGSSVSSTNQPVIKILSIEEI